MLSNQFSRCLASVLMILLAGGGLCRPAAAQCETESFIGSNTGENHQFGWAMDVDGDRAIVSSPGFPNGAVYFFRDDGAMWIQEDFETTGLFQTGFGQSVAIDGNVAVVGAPGDDTVNPDSGAAYVYRYDGANWNLEQKLTASDAPGAGQVGLAVAVRGTDIVLGSNVDKAYAFRFDGSTWNEIDIFTAFDGASNPDFGLAVALGGQNEDDRLALVGAPNANTSGSVYTFHYSTSNGEWEDGTVVTPNDGANNDRFGTSIDIAPSYDGIVITFIVGSPGHDANGPDAGAVYIGFANTFKIVSLSLDKLMSDDGGKVGTRVAVSANADLVASGSTVVGSPAGAVYLFEDFNTTDTFGRLINSDSDGDDRLGFSVGIGNGVVLAGAPRHDFDGLNNSGAVYEFPIEDCNTNDVIDCNDIEHGISDDCNENGVPDECELSEDCNGNGILDECDVASGDSRDCNNNGIPDICDINNGIADDCDGNNVPDVCDVENEFVVFRRVVLPPLEIPDGIGSYVSATLNVPYDETITNLRVGLRINHTYNGDLRVRLSHDGVTVMLIDRPGDLIVPPSGFSDDGFDIVLDDDGAGGPIEDVNPPGSQRVVSPPSYQPQEPLSAFDGMNLSGDWTLSVSDNANLDVGELVSFELILDRAPDCNDNGVPDLCEPGTAPDCDGNGVPDSCQIAAGEPDCNGNGVLDKCEIPGVCELEKLTGADESFSLFGNDVRVSSHVAIVGEPAALVPAAAYVYRLNEGTGQWEEEQVLDNPSAENGNFGSSVAIDGDVAVVGAFTDGTLAPDAGKVYVYRFDGLMWALEQELFASDGSEDAFFGIAVDVLGNTILIGADRDADMGAAYVFQYDSGAETWNEQTKLIASDAAIGHEFGTSVALGDRAALIGDSNDDTDGTNRGSAYVFVYDDQFEVWSEFDKLTADDGADGDNFGQSVAMSRDMPGFPRFIMIGAPGVDPSGAAYAYEWRAGGITPNGKLFSGSDEGSSFGRSVSLDGLICAIGDPTQSVTGFISAGAVSIFERAGDGVGDLWVAQLQVAASDPKNGGYGNAVGLSAPYLLVGAPMFSGDSAAYFLGGFGDCNSNGVLDCVDIFCGTSSDTDGNAVPDECAPPCPADIANSDGAGSDGVVNLFDLLLLIDNWGSSGAGAAISSGGGGAAVVDLFDLLDMLDAWGPCE